MNDNDKKELFVFDSSYMNEASTNSLETEFSDSSRKFPVEDNQDLVSSILPEEKNEDKESIDTTFMNREEETDEIKDEKINEEKDSIDISSVNHEEQTVDITDVGTKEDNFSSNVESTKIEKNRKYKSYQNRLFKYCFFATVSVLLFFISAIYYSFIAKETSSFTENSTANYQVCLKENNYYQDKCLGEDNEYISRITDIIRADFSYNIVYQKKEKRDYQYYIKSKMVMKTDTEEEKQFLKKEKVLTEKKDISLDGNVLSISDSADILFDDYNEFAQNYKNDYFLINNTDLVVSLILKEGKEEKEVSSITVPLTKLNYSIKKNEIMNQTGEYQIHIDPILKYVLMIGIFLGGFLTILSLLVLIRFLIKTSVKKTPYQKQLYKILSTYDRVIVSLENDSAIINDQDIYEVKSFLELLDVRDTIDKPILYYPVNDVKVEFYVQDVNKTYKFVMKESDFNKN